MSIPIKIEGNSGSTVQVSKAGELFTRLQFSSAEKISLLVDDTPVNIVKPRSGQKMIITGLIVNTNRDIGVNGAEIKIYEAVDAATATALKEIMTFDLVKNQTVVTAPLLIETGEGSFINAVADDSNVNVTLLCYFVPI